MDLKYFLNEWMCILNFLAVISNMINIDSCNSNKRELFGVLNNVWECKRIPKTKMFEICQQRKLTQGKKKKVYTRLWCTI